MKRILTGIQPSGQLHIGNYFGTIKRMVDYQASSDLFMFIANLHSLTTVTGGTELKKLTLDAAIDMLALGIDPAKATFWVQSDVPETAELMWILSCVTPMGLMERAHSYKDKTSKGIAPTLGLFNYPALMAADILINQVDVVPVGKDQKQHIEMTRDIAEKFNHHYGDVFKIPEPDIAEDVAVIPGIDGQKMSKSYGNTIPIFASEKEMEKIIMRITTDSKGVQEPKDPTGNTIYELFKLVATLAEAVAMADAFKKGGMGYGDAKKQLATALIAYFKPYRVKRDALAGNPAQVEAILAEGANKVRAVSLKTLEAVRQATGLRY